MKSKSLTQDIVCGGASKRPSEEAGSDALVVLTRLSGSLNISSSLWACPVPACHPRP